MADIRTNVIYLTTHCNLDCSYCYERNNRLAAGFKHSTVTSAEIDAFVEDVCTREAGVPSCVVIFGGEPLLKPALMEELISKFIKRKSGGINFDLVTNGTLITDTMASRLKELQETLPNSNASLQIEVSYDVSGQSKRIFTTGEQSDDVVLEGIRKLKAHNVNFVISYVISTANVDNVVRDVLYCILSLGAIKVGLKWAQTELEASGVNFTALKEHLKPRLQEIYRRYQIPICEEVCGSCQKCDKGKSGNNYCIPNVGIKKFESYVEAEFNHFLEVPTND